MKKKKFILMICLLLMLILTTSLTVGKYVYNSVWNYYLSSRNFYFESDLLNMNGRHNSLLKWTGENVYFNIRNSSNDKLVSDYNISYKVTCSVLGDESEYIECSLNDTEKSSYQGVLTSFSYCLGDTEESRKLNKSNCELNGYVWIDEPIKKDNYFNLKIIDDTKHIDEVSVKIVAESISPYHKTLIGIFHLNRVNELGTGYNVEYEEFTDYIELMIINKTKQKKCFTVDFNSNDYLIDIENDTIKELSELENANKITLEIEKESTFSNNFYKINSQKEYSINDFSIAEKEC